MEVTDMDSYIVLFRVVGMAIIMQFCLDESTTIPTVLTQHCAPFIYKPPLLTFCMNLLLRYIDLQLTPPSDSMTSMNERKVTTHRTTPYMKSSYLLASNAPTKRLATRRQARS